MTSKVRDMTRLRLLCAAAGLLLALLLPVSASASCADDVVAAATKGSIPGWYSPGCYSRASRELGSDLRDYSDVPDLIAAARRRDILRRLRIAVARRAPSGKLRVTFTPVVGSIRVSVFAKKHGRFVVAAIGTMSGTGGTIKARLAKATRIRVSASYVGAGDKPITVSARLKR
jgi:hypothetical protein